LDREALPGRTGIPARLIVVGMTGAAAGGSVDGHRVRLVVKASRDHGGATITGQWQGPLPLLLLIVGATLYFL